MIIGRSRSWLGGMSHCMVLYHYPEQQRRFRSEVVVRIQGVSTLWPYGAHYPITRLLGLTGFANKGHSAGEAAANQELRHTQAQHQAQASPRAQAYPEPKYTHMIQGTHMIWVHTTPPVCPGFPSAPCFYCPSVIFTNSD